ncbi:ATP-binding protein, partial [bacterium]|nr:ATP-binding protein [bacterium]
SSEENIPDYAPIFNWFKSLVILNDRSEFQLIERLMEDTPLSRAVGRWLHELDTGIVKLGKMPHPNLTEQVESDSIAEGLKELFRKNPDQKVMARLHTQGTYMIEPTQDGSLTASELAAIHRDDAGGEVPFPMAWLSDGSKVLIHLLPVFRLMVSRPMVLVVDELGRHFHHDLLLSLIDGFLRSCTPHTRSQLIFTTHNQSVMTQSLLRLDEMWVVEKHGNHSTLYSFVEFEGLSARTDVAKRYRQGHLGGLPTLYDPEWPEQMQGDDEG